MARLINRAILINSYWAFHYAVIGYFIAYDVNDLTNFISDELYPSSSYPSWWYQQQLVPGYSF
jgi:hypothetical protein